METKALIKSVLIVGLFAGAVLLGTYQFFTPQANPYRSSNAQTDPSFGWKIPESARRAGQVIETSAYSDFRDPGGVPRGLPVRLQIPIIGVDTAIEDAYITQDGRMDVPAGSVNVAWYALGTRPGQIGSAVIGGHYGIDNGVPRVFYHLEKLKIGDKVYIVDDNGNTLAFVVRDIRLFDRNADATTVFLSNDGKAHLNLITCEGIWNKVNDTYPKRRVVFTDQIPSEGPVVVKPLPIAVVPNLPETATDTTVAVVGAVKNLLMNPYVWGISVLLILTLLITTSKVRR